MSVYEKLKEKNITLPKAPAKGGVYTPVKLFGDRLAYVSGCGPAIEGIPVRTGKLGSALTLEEGQAEARACVLNILSVLEANLGSLDRVGQFVKLLVFVASDPDFTMQPQVANGASQLLVDLFGEEAGCASRSAIGVSVLPGDIPVEIEALVELKA